MIPGALMVHVPDIAPALAWYQRAFPCASTQYDPAVAAVALLSVKTGQNHFIIELVKADAKVASGPAGTVFYWQVEHLEQEIMRFKALGAALYRGPIAIENGLGMCQFRDPFGNLIGLKGTYEPLPTA